MKKKNSKTIPAEEPDYKTSHEEEFGFSTTEEFSRKTFDGKIPTKQNAFLEIIGSKQKVKQIRLGEDDITIGRSPECGLRIFVKNISRKHARIFYRNEEYCIEDLGSKNGIYINGIKVAKCVLKSLDQIEIGEMKMVFNDD